jgi:hypothetical protein
MMIQAQKRRSVRASFAVTITGIGFSVSACYLPTMAPPPAGPPAPPPVPAAAPLAAPVPEPVASLAGIWFASGFTCPGAYVPPEEEIRITQDGPFATAIKVIGDDCVPEGAITWRGNVDGTSFPVQVQVSNGPKTPLRFRDATVTLTGPDTLELSSGWTILFRKGKP